MGSEMKNKEKRCVYVIQMHTGSMPSKFVKFITRYEYSHVVISLKEDCKTTYSFGRKDLNNFLKGGFVEEKQNGEFFKKFKNTKCRIYELEVTQKQYDNMKKTLKERKKHKEDYKYDFLGIFFRFFHIPIHFENRAVCCQFVADVLEKGEVLYFDKPSYFVKTKDFDNYPEFKIVYEGLYTEY